MAVINFSIPTNLEKQVNQTIKDRGFSSKAEFFRLATIILITFFGSISRLARRRTLIDAIEDEIEKKFRGKRIPPIERVCCMN